MFLSGHKAKLNIKDELFKIRGTSPGISTRWCPSYYQNVNIIFIHIEELGTHSGIGQKERCLEGHSAHQ